MLKVISLGVKFACLIVCLLMANQAVSQTSTTTSNNGNGDNTTPKTSLSTSQTTPNGVEVEIGIASRIVGSKIANYQSTSGVLSLTNLGRATPNLLTGLGFSCNTASSQTTATSTTGTTTTQTTSKTVAEKNHFCNSGAGTHLGAFASVQFGSGSSQAITGYSVGTTFAVYSNLRLLAGYSMTPVSETSPGFDNVAAQYVTAHPTLFPGVNPANLESGAYGAFDGIQTTSTAPAAGAAPTAVIYYPGSVLETHYRGGLIIGVSFPINVYNLLTGNQKQQSQ